MRSIKLIGCFLLLAFFAVWAVLLDKYTRFGWVGYMMFLTSLGIALYFLSGAFVTSLLMLKAIQQGKFHEAIRMGELALHSGNVTNAIKIDLVTAYYHIGEIDKARQLIEELRGSRLSFMEKKLIDNWLLRIDEIYRDSPPNV